MAEPNLIAHISGGNHELFHTNVLAYIAKKYPDYFISIFRKECGEVLKGYDNINGVKREKDHFDLAIKKDGKYLFVLENKMKSVPDPYQLENYLENSDKAIHILLTMIKVEDNDVKPWIQISYEELAKRMNQEFKYQHFDHYFADFITDYIKYIAHLSEEINKLGFTPQTSIKELLEDKHNIAGESEWETKYLQKAQFQILANKIIQKYGKPLVCSAGIVRGNTPFIDIWPVFKIDANSKTSNSAVIKEWRKFSKEKHVNQYWCQIYSDHIERGFLVYYDSIPIKTIIEIAKESKKTKKAEKRYPFFKTIWDYCLEAPGLQEVAEKLNLNEQFKKNYENDKPRALMGYIYPEYAMVYVSSEIKDESIEKFVETISEELNEVYEILKTKH